MIKTLNLKLVTMWEYKKKLKKFAKGYAPDWSEDIFVTKQVKNTVSLTYVIEEVNGEEIVGTFYEKELQKVNQAEFRIEKVMKKKMMHYILKGKAMIIH